MEATRMSRRRPTADRDVRTTTKQATESNDVN